MKKKFLVAVSYLLILALGVMGTVAYFTDREAEVNVFTVGDVEIELNENFRQGVELMPGKKIEKEVTVANTGKNDAWVWVTIAIPSALDNEDASQNAIHFNYTKDSVGDGKWTWMNGTAWNVEKNADIEGDNNKYNIYTVMYQTALKPGAMTESAMTQVYMDTRVDMTPEGDLYIINNGVPENLNWNVNADKQGAPKFYVAAYAIQKDTFDNVQDAWAAYKGQWGNANNADFVSPILVNTDGVDGKQIYGTDAANKILDNLTKGTDLVVEKDVDLLGFDTNEVDAQGATVTLAGQGAGAYGYLAFLPDAGEAVELSNLNVTGSGFVEVGHYGMGGGNYEVNNLVIKDLAATLANGDKGFVLGCGFAHYGNAVLNNCIMTGTTAVQDGVLPVDAGFVNGTTTVVNGGEYGTVYCWSKAVVTLNGTEVDTLYVAPSNGTVAVKAGTHVEKLIVDYGTSTPNITKAKLAKLVIEAGATVDAIEYGGNTYTVVEWNNYVASL